MPYLPKEGEPARLVVNNEMKDVLVFHYFPLLWYRYPIPNKVREFWYTERPEILDYFQRLYYDQDVQFLPDNILKLEAEKEKIVGSLSNHDSDLISAFSNEIISKTAENQLLNLHILSEYWDNFRLPFL